MALLRSLVVVVEDLGAVDEPGEVVEVVMVELGGLLLEGTWS
ncbi:MAG: hypothetical protein R3F61_20195 [Myxococcota bacterium]